MAKASRATVAELRAVWRLLCQPDGTTSTEVAGKTGKSPRTCIRRLNLFVDGGYATAPGTGRGARYHAVR